MDGRFVYIGKPALLVLEDGKALPGTSFGAAGEVEGEVCFTTSMTGYQEILTDPSYRGQIVTMTVAHCGQDRAGILAKHDVELLGARPHSIHLAEDRQAFREAMIEEELDVPRSVTVSTVEEALAFGEEQGYPLILRPSFTLGGAGGPTTPRNCVLFAIGACAKARWAQP